MQHRAFLLIIDDAPIAADLLDYFAKFHIEIKHQKTLYPLKVEQNIPTAILINWSIIKNEPDMIHQFYKTYPSPILIINDVADEEICISVLHHGADDFLIKPIYPRELHARINAISRRVERTGKKGASEKEIYTFANWRLISASRQVFDLNNNELHLSAGEYDLLYTFVQQPQCILDRELLSQLTKNNNLNPFDRRIDVQISRLRQKIEDNAKKPKLIKTIRNGGYMFTSHVVVSKEND